MQNKKRLIDANAGKKRFVAIGKSAEYNGVLHMVVPISEIDKLPTVDAVPVVHAHWIKTGRGMRCSNPKCNCLSSLWDDNLKSTFCPWCGAKMDLEDKL